MDVLESLPHISALWPLSMPQAVDIALLGLFSLIIYRRYFYSISDVPGPIVASFTRLWHMRRIVKGDQNLQLLRLHDKFGHFVRIAHNEVSVSHPDGLKQILLAPINKASWYKISAMPDYRFESPMSILTPKEKNKRSKHLAPGYTTTNLLQSEEAMDRVMLKLMWWMDSYAESQKPMDLDKFFSYAAFDVVGEVLFSKQFGFIEQGIDIGNSIRNSLAVNSYVAIAGFFLWLHTFIMGNPVVTWLGILPMGHLFNTTMKAIQQREVNHDSRFDIATHWLKAHEENPNALKMRHIHSQAVNTVGAGSDTVSTAMQSFVYHMIRRPTAWQKARAEIQVTQADGLCHDRIISFGDSQRLPYLQACIREALRVFGPISMGLSRVAPKEGVTIGTRTFSEGTILSINPWVLHYSKECWGSDATEFNPDRWVAEDIGARERYLIPFGAGYASCPGQHLARIELSKMAATIVRDYDICQVNAGQEWQYVANFTAVPHSWPVYIQKYFRTA